MTFTEQDTLSFRRECIYRSHSGHRSLQYMVVRYKLNSLSWLDMRACKMNHEARK